MHPILILGAGKIGSLIALLLANSGKYQVYLGDLNIETAHLTRVTTKFPNLKEVKVDASDPKQITDLLIENNISTIVSALPFYCNIPIIKLAKKLGKHYFDLTEDTQTAKLAADLAIDSTSIFVPQCGLAPGFISIVANYLMQHFPELNRVQMRVGALPLNVSNPLQYALTWSTDGLINEYGNPCQGIEQGNTITLAPLDDLEEIKIDGLTYEAFNTSGGIGTLADTYTGKLKNLSYKTIRYPGHCAKMRFLMNDLKLNNHRESLKQILEDILPFTSQDVVLAYVSVTGKQDSQFCEENYVKKFYSQELYGVTWSAIQLTTASSLCAVLDIVLSQPEQYQGLVRQEHISFDTFKSNQFGKYFV